jgi:ketosteroid isomerase-like protein
MSDQQELRQRREALVQAVNRHDLEAVRSFIHPTFVGKTKQGFSVGHKEVVPMMEQLLAPGKDYQETVEIEQIEVSGDSAKLVTRRTERGRFHDPKRVDVANGLGLFFLLLFFVITLPKLFRVEVWDFENVLEASAYPVAIAVCFGSAFYMRRSRHRTVRYQETWRTIDGQWVIVEEQEL